MASEVEQDPVQFRQIHRLLQYVWKGNRVEIEKMVNLGVENLINLTEPHDGLGVLHVAVSANNLDLVVFLLSLGAQPNIQDKQGRTPVMLAAELGNNEILSVLVHKKADFKLTDGEGKGVLFYCNYPTKRHIHCLKIALKNQADANNVSAKGLHVFQWMCEKAHEVTPMCLIMLDAGADPNATNTETGITALMEAAKSGSLQLVRAILRRGGNPNALDMNGFTPAHYAAMSGLVEIVQVLSAHSADMCVMNADMCTPLHYAAATGNANCCKFLSQRGCNPKLKNLEGLLPRQIAKDSGHKAAVKELKKAEKQQGKKSKPTGGTMSDLWALTLHDWSNEFESELLQMFGNESDTVSTEVFLSVLEEIKAPVQLDQVHTVIASHDKKGEGFINITDFIKGVKYIKKAFLLSSYITTKKKGEKGGKGGKKGGKLVLPMPICTMLPELMPRRPDGGPPQFMIEKYYNHIDVRRFNRDHPPEHPIQNDSGWYIEKPTKVYINVNYCVRNENLESLEFAFSKGVPVDIQDQYYKTPLMVACSTGNYELVQYLLNKGADINMCDQFFWTPLHHAAFTGQLDIVKLLVEVGAAVDARSLNGGTPLMRAIENAQVSCVDYLIKAGASVNAESKKGKNCVQIAMDFGDSHILKMIKDEMDSPPKTKDSAKGKRSKT